MANTHPSNLHDPLVQDWVLSRLSKLSKIEIPDGKAFEQSLFHDLYIARLFDQGAHEALSILFRNLPTARFAPFVPRMLKQWHDWPDRLAGAAAPILAAHAAPEFCGLMTDYLRQNQAGLLAAERVVYLDALSENESTRDCWGKLIRQVAGHAQALPKDNLTRWAFFSILLRNALALEPNTLPIVVANAWREEPRQHAQDGIWRNLFSGLFGKSDFLDLVQARYRKHSTQRLAALAPLFMASTPLDTLDHWLDTQPPLEEVLETLASVNDERMACQQLHYLLSDQKLQALIGEHVATTLAVAGCLQGSAQDAIFDVALDPDSAMTFLAADLMGDRWIPGLVDVLHDFAHGEIVSQLASRLGKEYLTYGAVRIAQAMGRLGWVEFIPYLIDALASERGDFLCEEAMTALLRIGAPARDRLITLWEDLDSSQRIYGLSVIQGVAGAAAADFSVDRFDEFLSDDIESACALFLAEPEARLQELLRPHLQRRHPLIDRTFATMAKLLDREDEDSRETYARVLAEESRTQAIRARMDRGDLSRDAMPLDLRCPTCGETNSYLVSGVVVPGKTDDQLPYLIEDELPCASCGREVEFEFTPTAILGVSAELMLMQAASSTRQDREPLIRLQNIQIDGQVIPIAAGLRQIRKRLDDHPTDGRSWFRLANILNDLKRPRAALSALEKAAACAPHVVDVIVSRVELLTNQDREAESLDILCKALDQQFAWQFWGNTHVIGRQFVELYNHLRKTQGRQDLPAMHPASIRPPQPAKVGRNDSCPCGSGKKYKKCCG